MLAHGDSNASIRLIMSYRPPETVHDDGLDPWLDRHLELARTPADSTKPTVGSLGVTINGKDCLSVSDGLGYEGLPVVPVVETIFRGQTKKSEIPSKPPMKL